MPASPVTDVDGGVMLFKHEPCQCPPDQCVKGVAPAEDCVNRLSGTVEPTHCEACNGETLHHNGDCIRCRRLAEAKTVVPAQGAQRDVEGRTETRPALTLRIKCGDEFVVSDKRQVAKILKILLEDK